MKGLQLNVAFLCTPCKTNVDGIYDRPPEQPGAQLIAWLECTVDSGVHAALTVEGEALSGVATSTAAHDTTGGVAAKIAEAAAALAAVGEVRIARAGTPAAAAALRPGPLPIDWVGTRVTLAAGE